MNRKNVFIILLAAILVGAIVYIVYLSLGPYKSVSRENQELSQEIETRKASEAKMEKEIGRLRIALEDTRTELAQKTQLGKVLRAKVKGLDERI